MKLEEAYLIVENYDKVKNQDGMSARVNEAINALDKDIEKIRDIVENKRRIELTWNDLSSKHFKELMCNFYELADGSSKLLNDRKKYDLNPTGPIAIYQKIKELSVWIRKYNKMGYSLNIPSMEFGISLKEVYNDYRKDKANNATN